ncbi:MAG: hypothetical protein ABI584_00025 [Acidobacteriota bacterium]
MGRITPAGVISEFPSHPCLFAVFPPACGAAGIAAGPDGNLWIAAFAIPPYVIGRLTTGGIYTDVVPTPYPGTLWSITLGPDGNLWAVGDRSGSPNAVVRLTTSGAATLFGFPSGGYGDGARQIINGPDGNLWATETGQKKIARVTTSGAITEFPAGPGSPEGLAVGPDGAIWFTEFPTGIRRMTLTGAITRTIPTSVGDAICTGPDGNIWFGLFEPASIGRLKADGSITTYAIPSGWRAYAMVPGPDGNIWFAGGTTVGKVDLSVVRQLDEALDVPASSTPMKLVMLLGIVIVGLRLLAGRP